MVPPSIKWGLSLLLACLPAAAWPLDFRSVSVPRAVLYDAPSVSAKKRFSVSQYYPFEVIISLNAWVKVRDKSGEMAWIEARQLSDQRTLLVLEDTDVLAAPNVGKVFRVEKDVALEWVQPAQNGWVKVKHKDGLTGFVPVEKVWGL